MIVDYFKYNLYRKYQTSDGVTFTPLDEYQAVMTDYQINDDCGIIYYANLYYCGISQTQYPDGTKHRQFKVTHRDECISKIIDNKNYNGEGGGSIILGEDDIIYYRYDFYGSSDYELLGLQNNDITDMSNLFYGCDDLCGADLNKWDMSSVTNISHIFENCPLSSYIRINEWDTSSITNMNSAFKGCNGMTSIDISNWNTQKVTDMANMFKDCTVLKTIDISNWNTSSVTDMSYLFNNCDNLSTIENLDNWDTSNVTNMNNMFLYCKSLKNIPFTYLDTSKVTNAEGMFFGCESLTDITLHNFDFSSVIKVDSMFGGCSNLKSLDLSGCNFGNANLADMLYTPSGSFYSKLEKFNISNIKVNGSLPYPPKRNLIEADLSNINAVGVTNLSDYFSGGENLTKVNFENFIAKDITNISNMFRDCTSLTSLDLSGFDTRNVTTMSYMFYNCSNLSKLNLSNFDTSSLGFDSLGSLNAMSMFSYCNKLNKIICKKAFYEWCIANKALISLPKTMVNGTVGALGSGCNWELVEYEFIFGDEYICGSELGSGYEETSKYEVWKEYDYANSQYTGKIKYRNPQPSCDCGYSGYEYINTNNLVCGSEAVGASETYIKTYAKYEVWVEKDVCTNEPTSNVSYRNGIPSNDCGFEGAAFLLYFGSISSGAQNVINVGSKFKDFVLYKTGKEVNLSNYSGKVVQEGNDLRESYVSAKLRDDITILSQTFKSCMFKSIKLMNGSDLQFTNTQSLFENCERLTDIDFVDFNITNVTNMSSMFNGCNLLTHIKCKQEFKDWCITNQDTINLPESMREGGSGTWEIV